MSTQKLRSSTLSAIKMSLFTETMTSGSKFTNKEQTTPTISPTTSTLPLESSTGTRTTLSTTITANTTETSSTQVTSKPRYVRITSVVFQTVEATTFTTEPFSANSVSVTTVSVGARNEDEEKSKGIRTDTWVVVGVLLAGFAVLTSVVGIPLCKLTSCTQRRSSRVSASRNEV